MNIKRFVLFLATITALIVYAGCNRKKDGATQRSAALRHHINAWRGYGFDVNRTDDNTYILHINDPKTAVMAVMRALHLDNFNTDAHQRLIALSNGMRFGVEIDAKRLAANAPDALFVYYLGRGDEEASLRTLLQNKTFGAWLTLNEDNSVRSIRFKEVNATFNEKQTRMHIVVQNTSLQDAALRMQHPENNRYTFRSGHVEITGQNEHNITLSVAYRNLQCDVAMQGYVGNSSCFLPSLTVQGASPTHNESVHIAFTDINMTHTAQEHNRTVTTRDRFEIATIRADATQGSQPTLHAVLRGLHADLTLSDINASALRMFTAHVPNDTSFTPQQLRALGTLYTHMRATFNATMQTADINTSALNVAAKGYLMEATAHLDDTIRYREKDTLSRLVVRYDHNRTLFDIHDATLTFGIKKFFNFIPSFTELAAKDLNNSAQTLTQKQINDALNKIGLRILQHGFELYVEELGWKKLGWNLAQKEIETGRVNFALHAAVKPNTLTLDIDNPMTFMTLLSVFSAQSKLTLSNRDLQTLAKLLPQEAAMMLMMFAKQQGDNVVYELEIKNGTLTVNGQPLI